MSDISGLRKVIFDVCFPLAKVAESKHCVSTKIPSNVCIKLEILEGPAELRRS